MGSRHYFQGIYVGRRYCWHVYIGANSWVVKLLWYYFQYSTKVAYNISCSISQFIIHFCMKYIHICVCNPSNTAYTMYAHVFLPLGHFAPVCGCPGKAPWLAPGHGWVSWQSPPSRGQRAAGIHPHSAPQLLAASDHSTPPGHSSSCVCVSWVTREIQKVRGWWWQWIIQLGHRWWTR